MLAPKNWPAINKILSFKEKLFVSLLLAIIGLSFAFWIGHGYVSMTRPIPKSGGEYIEGIVGQPLYINPLLSQTSEADADLTQLVYNGLFTYDKDGKIIPDLAQSYEISEDQKTYTVKLKNNLLWHDGKQLDANDVVFTINILQDPSYKSPLRQNWQGVDVFAQDNQTLVFNLKNPYFGFLDNLTVGILPKHLWENIAPEKFALVDINLHPIGSGPYMFSDFQKDASGNILTYKLVSFKNYVQGQPYISKFTFNFYPDEDALIEAYNKKEVTGMGNIAPEKISQIKSMKSTLIHQIAMPRYFAVFFNQTKNAALADDSIRKALAMSVDRDAIVNKVLGGRGSSLMSPFLPQMKEYDAGASVSRDVEAANKLLEEKGWIKGDDGIRKKGSDRFSFEIIVPDWPELTNTAEVLKQQWKEIGGEVNVKILAVSDLQQNYIKTRDYDSLLLGQAISFSPDLYSFWHSSQKTDPGLNLALYDNKEFDKILEEIRTDNDENDRIEKSKKLQQMLVEEKEFPAVFLYSQHFLYPVNSAVGGIGAEKINAPSQRFADVSKWFMKTSRVLK